ncbi:uncharacterized protein B0H64DRAFT_400865 [Chaetomium fimeti]|uniref:Uncharacterized protein n=1 Tax=Chaetomium fimeti TaxID=1854472 RepID=A0AAE0LQU1_9PEZI|nr:hypothetical protein B0H64DRAFT_400865 [Chaetomium fimeti]
MPNSEKRCRQGKMVSRATKGIELNRVFSVFTVVTVILRPISFLAIDLPASYYLLPAPYIGCFLGVYQLCQRHVKEVRRRSHQ